MAADSTLIIIEGIKRHELTLRPGQDLSIGRQEPGGPGKTPEDSSDFAISEISPSEQRFATPSPYLSQNHAVLSLSARGKFLVKDLDSANGSWLRLTPHQFYELPENFELLLAKNLIIQSRTPLWETFPELSRLASASDFANYLRSQLHDHVSSVRVVSRDSPEAQEENPMSIKLPLLIQQRNREHGYLIVIWRLSPINLALEHWLQLCVFLFNSGPIGEPSPLGEESPWEFVAASPERQHVFKLAQKVARTSSTILLCGASGAGKEVLARDLHRHSSRAKKPFITLNCATLPADMIEAELFGIRRNASTRAENHIGLFEQAKDGTLFLDEIGELPPNLQARLVRALDQKVIRSVGDTEERPIKARIIAATNRNLEKLVDEGTFRSDLRFRLDAVQLTLPDLRPSDVSALIPYLLDSLEKEGFPALSEKTVLTICRLAAETRWPGNARELRFALERYLTFRDSTSSVEENWEKALSSRSPLPEISGRTLPPPVAADQLPDTLGQDTEQMQNLIFLTVARLILVPYRWGALKELGDKMGMTGAGAAARLRKLEISTDPEPSAAQMDARIAALQRELKPRLPLLRSLLGF